jgi:hypothetical protein
MDLITKHVLCGSRREDEWHRLDEEGPSNGSQQPALQTTVRRNTRLGRSTSRGEEDEQSRLALPKNLIRPLPVQDHKERMVPETCSPVRQCTPALGMEQLRRRRSSEERQNPNSIRCVLVEADG